MIFVRQLRQLQHQRAHPLLRPAQLVAVRQPQQHRPLHQHPAAVHPVVAHPAAACQPQQHRRAHQYPVVVHPVVARPLLQHHLAPQHPLLQ